METSPEKLFKDGMGCYKQDREEAEGDLSNSEGGEVFCQARGVEEDLTADGECQKYYHSGYDGQCRCDGPVESLKKSFYKAGFSVDDEEGYDAGVICEKCDPCVVKYIHPNPYSQIWSCK